jgi:hypothetical protein
MLYSDYRAGFICRHCATERQKLRSRFPSGANFLDLNYLYQRYAVSLRMSEKAACGPSRIVHRRLADGFAAQIAQAKLHGSLSPT